MSRTLVDNRCVMNERQSMMFAQNADDYHHTNNERYQIRFELTS